EVFAQERAHVEDVAGCRQRFARAIQEISLRAADAAADRGPRALRTVDEVKHRNILDALGDHVRAGYLRERDDRGDHAARAAVAHRLHDDRTLDLHVVELQPAHDLDAGVSGARVVERDAETGGFQRPGDGDDV